MSTPSANPSRLVYLDPAQALENIGDPGAVRDMLVMLQDVLERDLPQIAVLMDHQEFAGAQDLLHALKGCMPIFCTPTVCDELALVELMSKSDPRAASAPAYALLRPKLEMLRAEIASYLGPLSA